MLVFFDKLFNGQLIFSHKSNRSVFLNFRSFHYRNFLNYLFLAFEQMFIASFLILLDFYICYSSTFNLIVLNVERILLNQWKHFYILIRTGKSKFESIWITIFIQAIRIFTSSLNERIRNCHFLYITLLRYSANKWTWQREWC